MKTPTNPKKKIPILSKVAKKESRKALVTSIGGKKVIMRIGNLENFRGKVNIHTFGSYKRVINTKGDTMIFDDMGMDHFYASKNYVLTEFEWLIAWVIQQEDLEIITLKAIINILSWLGGGR